MPNAPQARSGCERTTLADPVTGREVWRMTQSDWHDKHAYYDVSPWSPDGKRIVFSSCNPADVRPRGTGAFSDRGHVFLMDADGSDIRWLTGVVGFNMHVGCFAHWTPDGRRILHGANVGGDSLRFHMTDVATGERVTLEDLHPRMACPDGRRVACQSSRGVVILSLDTMEQKVILTDEDFVRAIPGREPEEFQDIRVANLKWNPAGDKLIARFLGMRGDERVKELYVVNDDGSDLTRIDAATPRFHHHSWHVDGRRILYADRGKSGEGRLYFVDSDGANREMISDAELGGHPCLSPDGRRIVTDGAGGAGGDLRENLVLIDVGTGAVEKLVGLPMLKGGHAGTQAHPVWSPDGKQVLYDCDQTGTCQFYIVPMD